MNSNMGIGEWFSSIGIIENRQETLKKSSTTKNIQLNCFNRHSGHCQSVHWFCVVQCTLNVDNLQISFHFGNHSTRSKIYRTQAAHSHYSLASKSEKSRLRRFTLQWQPCGLRKYARFTWQLCNHGISSERLRRLEWGCHCWLERGKINRCRSVYTEAIHSLKWFSKVTRPRKLNPFRITGD